MNQLGYAQILAHAATLTFTSTFAGIGGFDKAWEDMGMTCLLQIEKDEHRLTVLRNQFPNTPKAGDICDVHGADLGRPDILVGGFPCKDISIGKGKREGLAGSRSGLYWEFHRLAEQHLRLVDATRPRWTVLENVPGLLTSNGGRDLAAVVMALEDIGYGWAYRVVDSRGVGSAQRRPRVVILGHRGGDPRPARLVLAGPDRRAQHLQVRGEPAGVLSTRAGRLAEEGVRFFRKSSRPRGTAEDGHYATYKEDGFLNTLTNNDSRSNAMQTHIVLQGGRLRALTAVEWERAQGFPDNWTASIPEKQRLLALGDAMHVDLASWLGHGIAAVDLAVPLITNKMEAVSA